MKPAQILVRSFLVAMVLMMSSCCHHQDLCCLAYPRDSDMATYCNNHGDAVRLFLQSGNPESEQERRLSAFVEFYGLVDDCETVECIEDHINETTLIQGFKEEYENEHRLAERDTSLDEDMKAGLILCGFRDAIEQWEQRLGKESK